MKNVHPELAERLMDIAVAALLAISGQRPRRFGDTVLLPQPLHYDPRVRFMSPEEISKSICGDRVQVIYTPELAELVDVIKAGVR